MATYKFQIVVGDRRTPLSMRMYDDGKDNDLANATVAFTMLDSSGATVVDAAACTVQPSIAFTADLTNDCYLATAHGLQDGWEVLVSSTTSLPSPLDDARRYFVRDCKPNSFNLSLFPNGDAQGPDTLGTGTHSLQVVGQVQYAWAAEDVIAAGTFKGWFTVTEDGVSDTFPNDSTGIAIVIARTVEA